METSTKIIIGLFGVSAIGYGYYKAVNKLSFAPAGIELSPDGTALQVKIAITNPSIFPIPFPPTTLTITDSSGNVLGTITSTLTQWIAANGVSDVYGVVNENVGTLATMLKNAITTLTVPTFNITGNINFGPIVVPVNTSVNPLSAISGYEVADYI
jgi:hypothetical protein